MGMGGCEIDLELIGGLSGKHAMAVGERDDLSIGMIQNQENKRRGEGLLVQC